MGTGIQPHVIACRAQNPVTRKVREKLSLYSNVPFDRVFSMHDCPSVYLIPDLISQAGVDRAVVDILGLGDQADLEGEGQAKVAWSRYVQRLLCARETLTIGITGKYTSLRDSYASIIQALEHAGTHNDVRVQLEWIDTSDINDDTVAAALEKVQGVIVPG